MLGFKSRYPHIYGVGKISNKRKVKIGDRIELLEMKDTMTSLRKGDRGTVFKIEKDQDITWIDWDNGEKLALLDGIDKFKIVKK
ncbi:MAG: DUF4314 domain-containing protein [Candidatus Thermoplasmatota archaeon]|nr:DUF4314 domain-containing protein [Candidatus Thermoplasmatota archaeon]